MLPSCGHFKTIPCPFYKFALCVRPHCPYKHHIAENSQQRQFSPLVDETETAFDSENELNSLSHESYETVTESSSKATYIPTPVESNSKPPGILKSSSNVETPATSYVPEYKPTPIAKLKEITTVPIKASKSVYTPEFPVAIRKRKNVEEYDPTEVKCIPKKTVTFVDEADTSTVPVILLSSDDDSDDCGDVPQFSDDDFDEERITNPVINSTKQVPDIITLKEEPIEEENIDEFSVVDKILVDCKKNERLLNSLKKIRSKTHDLSSKIRKSDKIVAIEPEKQETKKNKSSAIIEKNISGDKVDNSNISAIKLEKNVSDVKMDCNTINKNNTGSKSTEKKASCDKLEDSKLKHLKNEVLDLINSPVKSKSTDNLKKDDKNVKKDKACEKEKKISSSHSTHSKEKLKKGSKEVDKHVNVKKHSQTQKTNSSDSKSKKSSKHSSSESSGKKELKKFENHAIKNRDRSCSPTKKKRLHENENSSKTAQPHIVKLKEKKSSDDHSVKRKFNSDSDKHSSKHKSFQDEKKSKSDSGTFPSKKPKFCESQISDSSKPLMNVDKMDNSKDSDSDSEEAAVIDPFSSSDSDPDEECRRIFEECYPDESESAKQERKKETQQPKSSDASELVIMRKKRFAHPGAAEINPPNKQPKEEMKRPLNPAQVMHNRFLQTQAKFAQLNEKKEHSKGTEKKRLCFIPNKNLLDAVKNKNQSNPALENFNPLPPTVSKTYKATQRTAHIPEVAKKPRPIIPAEYGSKVPANLRQRFLNSFIDNCLKFCSSEDEAYEMALEEEKRVYDRSSSKTLYLNLAANALHRLRRRAEEGPDAGNSNAKSKANTNQKTVSHQAVLNGPLAQRRSFSIGKKKEVPEIRGKAELYEYLLEYVLTPEQLKENSYPLPHPTDKSRAVIEGAYANRTLYCNDAFKRMCSRCRKTYYVNVDGDYVREEECDFHWGRLWKKRIAGNFESRYSCCQGDAESDGCCVSPGHVFEGSENHVLRGYVNTLPKTPPPDNCYGIYALDCEMCYTTAGIELTRITVVDTDLKTIYESFVKPTNKVLDYNTRFSGITEDDLKNVRTTLCDVQAVLLCIFNDRSILIGHSLESDFKALKLFHKTVIDTSVVFPHKSGLPYKRALKTLMGEKLNKIIQNDVGGHDSREDAVACMELMLWKVKEDIRSNR